MTFAEAKTKLAEIATGKHYSLSYDEMIYSSGLVEVKCRIYIANGDFYSASTWEQAFLAMEAAEIKPYSDEVQPKMDVKEGL